jgi:hypothetical protein
MKRRHQLHELAVLGLELRQFVRYFTVDRFPGKHFGYVLF